MWTCKSCGVVDVDAGMRGCADMWACGVGSYGIVGLCNRRLVELGYCGDVEIGSLGRVDLLTRKSWGFVCALELSACGWRSWGAVECNDF